MIKETRGEKIFNYINVVLIALFTIIIALPLINVILNSFVTTEEAFQRSVIIIPHKFSLAAYELILAANNGIINGYKVTIFRVVAGTALNMFFSYILAYTIAKDDLPGKRALTIYIFFIMLFSGGLIPYYIVVKATYIMNNLLVYILPTLVQAYNVLLLRNFIMQIPSSFSESAEIDGAPEMTILFKIIMPLSKPAMVTIALFYAVYHWNDWFTAYLFIRDSNKYPVQMVLRDILINANVRFDGKNKHALNSLVSNPPPANVIQNAAVVITTLPIVFIYPFFQKHFVKGIMIGGVKG